MPDPAQILEGLTRAANDGFFFSVAWHVAAAAVVIGIAAGWRPSNRDAGVLLAAPLVSVSVVSFGTHNPFNGIVFALLAIALSVEAVRFGDRAPASSGPRWSQLVGAGLLAFGWVYPHFLVDRPAVYYLVAAPLGLIPCPTLAAVIGLSLLAGAARNRAWSGTLAVGAAFYALFGVVRLGVWMDLVLLVGAASLGALTIWRAPSRDEPFAVGGQAGPGGLREAHDVAALRGETLGRSQP